MKIKTCKAKGCTNKVEEFPTCIDCAMTDQDWFNLLRGGPLKSCPQAKKRTLESFKKSNKAFESAIDAADREWEED